MELALKIIKREIAQRELANKHDHLRKEICTKELQSLDKVVNLLSIQGVSTTVNCEHTGDETLHQGNGFIYKTCADCGEDI